MIRAEGIEIGNHVTVTIAGMTLNLDTIWSTVIAGGIVVGLGFWMRSKVTSGAAQQDPADVGGRGQGGHHPGRGQPRPGAPVRGAAGGRAVLLHPDLRTGWS